MQGLVETIDEERMDLQKLLVTFSGSRQTADTAARIKTDIANCYCLSIVSRSYSTLLSTRGWECYVGGVGYQGCGVGRNRPRLLSPIVYRYHHNASSSCVILITTMGTSHRST